MAFPLKTRPARERRPTAAPVPDGGQVCLYGWDSQSATWHGPSEPGYFGGVDKRLLRALEGSRGGSWFGSVRCAPPGEISSRFFVLVHDLADCAVASIYCDESKTGPAEILAVIPPHRRARLRQDFAFEFLAFARFLRAVGEGAELEVYDAMEGVLANAGAGQTVAFSISSGLLPGDLDYVLSCCVEKVAVTLCRWLAVAPVALPQPDHRSITAA